MTETLDPKLHGFDLLSEHALPGDFSLQVGRVHASLCRIYVFVWTREWPGFDWIRLSPGLTFGGGGGEKS